MTHRTLVLSSFEDYLACEGGDVDEIRERKIRLHHFPYAVMFEMAYPELDFAIRWCQAKFGPMDGVGTQKQSEYRVCSEEVAHGHHGKWTSHWFVKTNYDFGYNEFYFATRDDYEVFIAHLSEINWGEHYQKQ